MCTINIMTFRACRSVILIAALTLFSHVIATLCCAFINIDAAPGRIFWKPLPNDEVFLGLQITERRVHGGATARWIGRWQQLRCDKQLQNYGIANGTIPGEGIPLATPSDLKNLRGSVRAVITADSFGMTLAETCEAAQRDMSVLSRAGGHTERGWPMATAWCELKNPYDDPPHFAFVRGGLYIDRPKNPPSKMPSTRLVIPLRPIPLGLLLNTLFYATLWSILLFAPRAIRRHLRTKHHRCPTCNYDLRNLPTTTCPECGTPS